VPAWRRRAPSGPSMVACAWRVYLSRLH
jgi:hypothetical protein